MFTKAPYIPYYTSAAKEKAVWVLWEAETHMSLRIQLCHTPDQATVDKYWFCVKKLLESWMC